MGEVDYEKLRSLNYGSREETATKVLKKMIHSALCLAVYFRAKKAEIMFVTPKAHGTFVSEVKGYIESLENFFKEDVGCDFQFEILFDSEFYDKITQPVFDISERQPDGCNNQLMKNINRLINITFFTFFLANTLPGQVAQRLLTKEEAVEDFQWCRFALEYCHPRLYKFEDQKTIDARFDSLQSRIGNEISGLDFLGLMVTANAAVRCGHLYTIPTGDLQKEVLGKAVLPFQVKILDHKIYLINNCSEDTSISNGSEILSINGRTSVEILNLILPRIAADGYIETRKKRLAERCFYYSFHGFDLYFHLFCSRERVFTVECTDKKTNEKKTVIWDGMTIEERQKILKTRYNIEESEWFRTPSPRFEWSETGDFAVLTISRSFNNPEIDPDYDSLLASAFGVLKTKNIKNLIVDLRNNEGGSEHQQSELMSYIYAQPFKLYQNIYVSQLDYRPLKSIIFREEKDTSRLLDKNEDEWMRKISDNLWINNYEYYFGLQDQLPKKDVFAGNIYVLMNGNSFSSTSALIANIKNTTKAIFIGEECGGLYEGPTGGQTIPIVLPNSKIMVRISPNIHLGSLYKKHPIGRGVLPDYSTEYTIDDILLKKDLEMNLAKKLIEEKK